MPTTFNRWLTPPNANSYLHQLSPMIVHRDLKSANVLLFEGWRAKITE